MRGPIALPLLGVLALVWFATRRGQGTASQRATADQECEPFGGLERATYSNVPGGVNVAICRGGQEIRWVE